MNESTNRFLNPVFKINETSTYGITVLEQDFYTDTEIQPMDLSGCTIRMNILNSTHPNAKTLLLKVITEDTPIETTGCILDPASGEFALTFTSLETKLLGVGRFPFVIKVYDSSDNEILDFTSYNTNNEFNCIDIVDF